MLLMTEVKMVSMTIRQCVMENTSVGMIDLVCVCVCVLGTCGLLVKS